MEVIKAPVEIKNKVNQFYRAAGYSGSWGENEQAYCLSDSDNIVGAVKVESLEGVLILRGMYIASDKQSNGYGSLLLSQIEPVLNKAKSYCLPFDHLEDFYGKAGFVRISETELPAFLQKRLGKYVDQGHSVMAMMREAS
ncbi:GNAT family N-acetyltransferase [Sansalvadorimonas sp. 2012CJ34-2]|uniref:GNAT family N-acetyltransferase n=1 Tax=Parendozoicomonas callyspongiae TaxID=2942213 RepID=A0ABT0PMD7_9GAMM|nr:GNAT family N-acetyltransferase [Sansalvadorimonas sp. 2012CJ34-2]MCL6271912.1 GNAT family N-acetyltransferase [Sansalvadorimonas sp. 2012CJ34-2]